MYDRLDEDLASKTVERRAELIKKWNKGNLSSLSEWPDRLEAKTNLFPSCDNRGIVPDSPGVRELSWVT